MGCGGVPLVHVVAVVWGSLEVIFFAGVIFGWHSVVYIYKDTGYFEHLCPASNISASNATLAGDGEADAMGLYNDSLGSGNYSSLQAPYGSTPHSLHNASMQGEEEGGQASCEERLVALQQRGKDVCFIQDMHFNLIFSLATSITGLCCVAMGFLYDRFGTRFLRCLALFLHLVGLLCLIFSSPSRPFQLYPGFLLTTLGGYAILLTNLQLAGLIPSLRSTLMSLYSGSYDCSAAIFLLFKVGYESGLVINYCFAIQMAVFSMVLASTFLVLPRRRLPWPLPPNFRLRPALLRCCRGGRARELPGEAASWTSQEWSLDDNGSIILSQAQLYTSSETLDGLEVVYDIADRDMREMVAQDLLTGQKKQAEGRPEDLLTGQKKQAEGRAEDLLTGQKKQAEGRAEDRANGQTVLMAQPEPVPFGKVVLSPLFLWDLLWMCIQRLRSWFFVGIFNSWITRLACGDRETISHYTSVYASMQFFGILTAPLSGRLMDRKTRLGSSFRNPRFARLHASIASFMLNSTVSVLLSILVAIPVLEVQYVSFFLHTIHRSFLYGPNSAFVANAFPTEHFGKLFGITLTVSAVFGSLQYPLFLIIQGPLNNNPLAVNILFIVLMLASYTHPLYIWSYVRSKHRQQKESEKEASH